MRRDLLAASLKAVRDGKEAGSQAEAAPRKLSGVLDVQRGLDRLAAGAARPISPAEIAESAIRDRFDVTDGIEELITSIQASGQRLPVLLRRTRSGSLPYEVVYGRRRIEVCRRLGIDVLAYVSEMDDREALISQGLENAARLQRSFIEQSVYADRLLDHGLSREEICNVLAIDKTTLSRMLGVVEAVPAPLIAAIGAAHDSGRRPWLQLRELLQARRGLPEGTLLALVPADQPSTLRLQALLSRLTAAQRVPLPPPTSRMLGDACQIEHRGKKFLMTCTKNEFAGFAAFLDGRLDDLLQEYLGRGTKDSMAER